MAPPFRAPGYARCETARPLQSRVDFVRVVGNFRGTSGFFPGAKLRATFGEVRTRDGAAHEAPIAWPARILWAAVISERGRLRERLPRESIWLDGDRIES